MKKSIKRKILALVLGISILSIVLLSAVAFIQLKSIGSFAAQDSAAALTQAGKEQLLANARAKADMSDEKLTQLQNTTIVLRDVAEKIYQSPQDYPLRKAFPALDENAGKIVVQQFFDKTYVESPQTLEELALLANLQDFLEQFARENPAIGAGSIYIATETGIIYMADVESNKHSGDFRYEYIHTRPWYDRAKKTGELGWTDVVTDISGRGLGIVCSAPVYDAGKNLKAVVGVGAMLIDLEQIVTMQLGETGYTYIMNNKGNIILSEQSGELAVSNLNEFTNKDGTTLVVQESILSSPNGQIRELSAKMQQGEAGVTTITVDGNEVFAAYAPISTLNWSFGAIITTNEVLLPSTLLRAHRPDAVSLAAAAACHFSTYHPVCSTFLSLALPENCKSIAAFERWRF